MQLVYRDLVGFDNLGTITHPQGSLCVRFSAVSGSKCGSDA